MDMEPGPKTLITLKTVSVENVIMHDFGDVGNSKLPAFISPWAHKIKSFT